MRNKTLEKTLKEVPLKSKIKVKFFILLTRIKNFLKQTKKL